MREEFAYFWPYENMKLLRHEDIKPFNVQLVGRSFCDGSYHIFRPDSPIWIFEYIHDGKGYLSEDGNSFTAEKGDIYILHKNKTHIYSSDAEWPWVKTFFCIYGNVADALMDSYGLKNINLVKGIFCEDLFNELYDSVKASSTIPEMNDNCLAHTTAIMQKISRFIPFETKKDNIAELVRSDIDNIADFSLPGSSFSSIVKRMGYSEEHIIREFKKEFGITPYRYMTEVRIRLASNMLIWSKMSISEISEYTGFCDQHHFSVTFKSITGQSPLQYRKNFAKNDSSEVTAAFKYLK